MRILITDVKRNIAHTAVALGQQMLCRLDADSGQIFDKGLTGLLRKHGGKMVRTDQGDSPRERPLKIVSDEGNTVTVVIGNKTQTVTKNSDGTLTLNSDGMTIKLKRK